MTNLFSSFMENILHHGNKEHSCTCHNKAPDESVYHDSDNEEPDTYYNCNRDMQPNELPDQTYNRIPDQDDNVHPKLTGSASDPMNNNPDAENEFPNQDLASKLADATLR